MYSKKIQSLLKKQKIHIGDEVIIKTKSDEKKGILMPRPEIGDPEVFVLKLDSGYNIGISSKDVSIKLLKKSNHDLGKVSKPFLSIKFNSKNPPVSLISSGGTIASRVDYKTGGVFAVEDPREFLHNVPELADIINLKTISSPIKKMSEDFDYKDWIQIAQYVFKDLKSHEGVIVTHGTDTLHYTSAALSFFIQNPGKPVVLIGSQKSPDRGSSDAGMNLICAAHASISDIAEVGTCMHGSMNDDFCLFTRGTKVRKMSTVRRDAFRPINDLPLAKIHPNGKLQVLNKDYKKRSSSPELDIKFEPKIALVKAYPSSDPGVLDYYLKSGVKGLVIEGMGLGHVPTQARKSWLPQIKSAINSGVPVVVTSQTIYGRVNPNVYTNLRLLFHKAGAISGEDMLSETAFIKLGWVLGHTKSPEKIKEMMSKNIAGEITSRSLPDTFLY